MESLKKYVDDNVSDLKDFIASVAKKLPMPVKFTSEEKWLGASGVDSSKKRTEFFMRLRAAMFGPALYKCKADRVVFRAIRPTILQQFACIHSHSLPFPTFSGQTGGRGLRMSHCEMARSF